MRLSYNLTWICFEEEYRKHLKQVQETVETWQYDLMAAGEKWKTSFCISSLGHITATNIATVY
jgi:hypothetical protein